MCALFSPKQKVAGSTPAASIFHFYSFPIHPRFGEMIKISSRENQKIIQARKTRDGKDKNLIFVEGLRLAEEVLISNLKIREIFCTEQFAISGRGQAFLQDIHSNLLAEVSENVFNSLADTKNSQGIIVIAEKPPADRIFLEQNLNSKKTPLVILLHRINNPSNLGAILRTAEAVDAAGIILTKNSADAFSPKALRGAMGAAFRLPVWSNADFSEALDWAKKYDLSAISAEANAEKSYLEVDWKRPRLLIFGSEAHGLSAEEREKVEESMTIPMENKVESLNLAVSCGVILFEAKRQNL